MSSEGRERVGDSAVLRHEGRLLVKRCLLLLCKEGGGARTWRKRMLKKGRDFCGSDGSKAHAVEKSIAASMRACSGLSPASEARGWQYCRN